MSNIALKYTTTDGRQFDTRGEALRHERLLQTLKGAADRLSEKFGFEPAVSANIVAFMAADHDLLYAMMGRTPRKNTSEDAQQGQDEPQAGDTSQSTPDA